MPTIKQIELPDDLAESLARRAAAHAISVEQQIVEDLSQIDAEFASLGESDGVEQIRRDRAAMARRGAMISDDFLADAKAWGRK